MIKFPKGDHGSGLYKLGLHHTLVVDRGSLVGKKNQLHHNIISFTNPTRRSSQDFMLLTYYSNDNNVYLTRKGVKFWV
jgi:hypothetical protein